MDINDNGVDLLVGFITRGIAAIWAARNTGKVTLPLPLGTVRSLEGAIFKIKLHGRNSFSQTERAICW
jgi:hypothetical protein